MAHSMITGQSRQSLAARRRSIVVGAGSEAMCTCRRPGAPAQATLVVGFNGHRVLRSCPAEDGSARADRAAGSGDSLGVASVEAWAVYRRTGR
jgi:hypothetical protein